MAVVVDSTMLTCLISGDGRAGIVSRQLASWFRNNEALHAPASMTSWSCPREAGGSRHDGHPRSQAQRRRTSDSPVGVFPERREHRRTQALADVWDNFGFDPATSKATLATAGQTARKYKLDRAEVDDLTAHRYEVLSAQAAPRQVRR